MQKMYKYGIRGVAHSWLCSYLSDRWQYVSCDKTNSVLLKVKCRVPQGSVIGPKLFILYLNELCKVSKYMNCILFADDTNFFCSGEQLTDIITTVENEMKLVKKMVIQPHPSLALIISVVAFHWHPSLWLEAHRRLDLSCVNKPAFVTGHKLIAIVLALTWTLDCYWVWRTWMAYCSTPSQNALTPISDCRHTKHYTLSVSYNSISDPQPVFLAHGHGILLRDNQKCFTHLALSKHANYHHKHTLQTTEIFPLTKGKEPIESNLFFNFLKKYIY